MDSKQRLDNYFRRVCLILVRLRPAPHATSVDREILDTLNASRRFAAPEWLITTGSAFFILALTVSAVFVPELRGLHAAQAAMYLSAIYLSIRQDPWGYFIGASAAGFWDATALFGSPLFVELFSQWRSDSVLQGLAWLANLAIVVGSVLGYRRLGVRSRHDMARFAVALVGTTGFLVGATALLAPSYLSHLAWVLHPHWPWTRQ